MSSASKSEYAAIGVAEKVSPAVVVRAEISFEETSGAVVPVCVQLNSPLLLGKQFEVLARSRVFQSVVRSREPDIYIFLSRTRAFIKAAWLDTFTVVAEAYLRARPIATIARVSPNRSNRPCQPKSIQPRLGVYSISLFLCHLQFQMGHFRVE